MSMCDNAASGAARRVVVLADTDSRWKWGAELAKELAPGGFLLGYLLRGRATPSARQLVDVGIDPDEIAEVTVADFVTAMRATDADVVVLSLAGTGVQALLHGLARVWANHPRRPVVVAGYVGVVFEKIVHGLMLRAGSDLVIANSATDAERFRAIYAGTGADPSTVVEAALPFLAADREHVADPHRPFTVTFAAQPGIPGTRADREYVLNRLIRHATLYPQRDVVLKLRNRPGEQTTHLDDLPYDRIAPKLGTDKPANLHLLYGHMGAVLDRTDVLVTVSSTAALEAMQRGIPSVVLTDFGVREALGNHYFIGSGALGCFDDLDNGHLPAADPAWLAANGVGIRDPYRRTRERVDGMLAGEPLPPLRPYYTAANAPAFLRKVLGRHGLDENGRPRGRGLSPDGWQTAARGVAREAARRVYRAGAGRLAGWLRRVGEV